MRPSLQELPLGNTVQELPAKTEMTPGVVAKIENSGTPPPIPTRVKIAYALNVHVSYFFEESGEDNGFIGAFTLKWHPREKI